jgi:hypothetical protein
VEGENEVYQVWKMKFVFHLLGHFTLIDRMEFDALILQVVNAKPTTFGEQGEHVVDDGIPEDLRTVDIFVGRYPDFGDLLDILQRKEIVRLTVGVGLYNKAYICQKRVHFVDVEKRHTADQNVDGQQTVITTDRDVECWTGQRERATRNCFLLHVRVLEATQLYDL